MQLSGTSKRKSNPSIYWVKNLWPNISFYFCAERKSYYVKNLYNKFLDKLYDLVDDEETDHIVTWNSADLDSGFTIVDSKLFEQEILPKYFKHKKLGSFIRQLNMYDFHKKNRRQRSYKVFYNPNFKKGGKDLLVNIKRKSLPME